MARKLDLQVLPCKNSPKVPVFELQGCSGKAILYHDPDILRQCWYATAIYTVSEVIADGF